MLLTAAAAAAGLVPVAAGLPALGPVGGVLAVLLVGLLVVVAVCWAAGQTSRGTDAGSPAGAPPAGDDGLRQLLQAVPADILAAEWRASEEQLRAQPKGQQDETIARFRQLLVEEMHRRDR